MSDRSAYISLRRFSRLAPGAYCSMKLRNLTVGRRERSPSDSMAMAREANEAEKETVHCPRAMDIQRAARLDRGASRKKNVKQECQLPVLSHPPKVRDRPQVAHFHRVLKDERVLSHLRRSARRVRRRRQDLYPRALSSPGTGHAEAAKAAISPNLDGSATLDVRDDLLPLS